MDCIGALPLLIHHQEALHRDTYYDRASLLLEKVNDLIPFQEWHQQEESKYALFF